MRRTTLLFILALSLITAVALAAPMPQEPLEQGGCGCGCGQSMQAGSQTSSSSSMCKGMGSGDASGAATSAGRGHCGMNAQAADTQPSDGTRSMGRGPAGQGKGPDESSVGAMNHGAMDHGAMNHGAMADRFEVMGTIHFLIDHHEQIEREVQPIEGGVLTTTRAPKNPELAPQIQQHVREMWNLLDTGGAIRMWDPLFREVFAHADQIELTYEDLPDGIRVRETSADPDVVALIRAHAAKVDEFVARGRVAMHEETPLPTN